jgi:hypothetical protein
MSELSFAMMRVACFGQKEKALIHGNFHKAALIAMKTPKPRCIENCGRRLAYKPNTLRF